MTGVQTCALPISAAGRTQYFNIATGVLGSSAAVGAGLTLGNSTITPCYGGWMRCSITVTTAANTTLVGQITQASADLSNTTTIGYTLYMWGAQLEARDYPTSYISSTSSQAVRQADILNLPTSMIQYNGNEGTLYVEAAVQQVTGNTVISALDDGTTNNLIQINTSGTGFTEAINTVASNQVLNTIAGVSINTFYRMVASYYTNNSNNAMNGILSTADTSCVIPTVNILRFGTNSNGTTYSCWIRQVVYFPRRLSDSDLAALTM